jgi:two-component sensor histidine kinase
VILCDLVSEIAPTSAELARPGLEPKIEIAVPAPVKLKRDHAVPVALILNELLLNACKHGEPPITVLVAPEGDATVVTVRNKRGPAAVDGDLGSEAWFGTGLGIARLLVPHDGATLTFAISDGDFVARLALRAPVTAN